MFSYIYIINVFKWKTTLSLTSSQKCKCSVCTEKSQNVTFGRIANLHCAHTYCVLRKNVYIISYFTIVSRKKNWAKLNRYVASLRLTTRCQDRLSHSWLIRSKDKVSPLIYPSGQGRGWGGILLTIWECFWWNTRGGYYFYARKLTRASGRTHFERSLRARI